METHDWSLLERPGVAEVIERATARIARRTGVDADDLQQEAGLLVAGRADLRQAIEMAETEGSSLGLLRYRLEFDLLDIARTLLTKASRNTSWEERYNDETDYAPAPVALSLRNDTSLYTRELVEQLLPAVWDESFAYGMRSENAPDADMPRGAANKATGGTLAAHIADIKWGWKRAPLTPNERRAILLSYGFDVTQVTASRILGVSQSSISNWLYSGVGKIVARLNGDTDLADYLTVLSEELVEMGVV